MSITANATLNQLRRNYSAAMRDGLLHTEQNLVQVATKVPSNTRANVYGWLSDFPQVEEWTQGNTLPMGNLKENAYELVNKTYAKGVQVDVDQLSDDITGLLTQMVIRGKLAGQELSRFQEHLVFSLLKGGDSALGYDGQNFFDTDHPIAPNTDGTGSPVSTANLFGTAGSGKVPWYLLDCSHPVKPLIFQERLSPEVKAVTNIENDEVLLKNAATIRLKWRGISGYAYWQMAAKSYEDLTEDNFYKVMEAMMSLTADGGRPLGINPTHLIVPPTLKAKADKLILAQLGTGGMTNTLFGSVKVITTSYVL